MKQDKYTKSAHGQACQLRITNCSPKDTVVFCHLNGGGMGKKSLSIHGFYGCSRCHDAYDRRDREWRYSMEQCYLAAGVKDYNLLQELVDHYINSNVLRAVKSTQEIMVKEGILIL